MNYLILFIAILLCLYIPNSGGQGQNLPINLTFILWLGMVFYYLAWQQKQITVSQSQPSKYLLLGGGGMLLPWLFFAHQSPGVWVLLAALLLWCVLLSLPLGPMQKRTILRVVVLLAVCQGIQGLLQVFFPEFAMYQMEYDWLRNSGRPYGIFQQVNLLASFLATGVACTFLLFLTARRYLAASGYLLIAGLLIFVISINQSRTGMLGVGITILMMAGMQMRNTPWRVLGSIAIFAFTGWIGWFVTQHLHIVVNGERYLIAREYSHSTLERWNILYVTLQMILQKPWLGWGYGSFEYAFSRYVLQHSELHYTYTTIVTHPHNELLNAWFQGGIVAFSGMLIMFASWLAMVVKAIRHSRISGLYSVLILPLIIHLCLEYPFSQSFIHFALFLLLLRLGCSEPTGSIPVSVVVGRWLRGVYSVAGTGLIILSVAGLYANYQMTKLERSHLIEYPNPAPWYFSIQGERAQFDGMVALLIAWNKTHDEKLLDCFMQQAQEWSQRHNDRNVWQSMIMIARHQGDTRELAYMQSMYERLFPYKTGLEAK